jgi:hypothetical protein
VPGANPDMIRVAHAKIEMSGIQSFPYQNAKMIIGNKIAREFARNDSFEP